MAGFRGKLWGGVWEIKGDRRHGEVSRETVRSWLNEEERSPSWRDFEGDCEAVIGKLGAIAWYTVSGR
jgi:hypothetical protein